MVCTISKMLTASKICLFLVRRISSFFYIMLRKSFYFVFVLLCYYLSVFIYSISCVICPSSVSLKINQSLTVFWAVSLMVCTISKMLIASKICLFLVRRISSFFYIMLRKSFYFVFVLLCYYLSVFIYSINCVI